MNFKYCMGDVTVLRPLSVARSGRIAALYTHGYRPPRRLGNGNFHRGSFACRRRAASPPLPIPLPLPSVCASPRLAYVLGYRSLIILYQGFYGSFQSAQACYWHNFYRITNLRKHEDNVYWFAEKYKAVQWLFIVVVIGIIELDKK